MLQYLIAHRVAVIVIHTFEVVQVQQYQRQRIAGALRLGGLQAAVLIERAAVVEVGQFVDACQSFCDRIGVNELVFEAPTELAEEYVAIVCQEMENAMTAEAEAINAEKKTGKKKARNTYNYEEKF